MPPERPTLLAAACMAPYPLFNGYAVRVHNLLKHLARQWRITLVSPAGKEPWPLADRMEAWHRMPGDGTTAEAALTKATIEVLEGSSADVALLWGGAEGAALSHPDLFPPGHRGSHRFDDAALLASKGSRGNSPDLGFILAWSGELRPPGAPDLADGEDHHRCRRR